MLAMSQISPACTTFKDDDVAEREKSINNMNNMVMLRLLYVRGILTSAILVVNRQRRESKFHGHFRIPILDWSPR
jgi:hypothetical protein